VKPRLPKYPTCIVTMSMDPKTLLRSAEHTDVNTMHVQAHATRWVDEFKLDIPEFQGDLQPKEFIDQVAAVGEVLDFNEVLEDQWVSFVTTKLIDEDLLVDWASPPIYDIYPDEESLLKEVNLVLDTIILLKVMMFTLCLKKVQRVKYLNRVLRKLIMLIFLGLKLFYQRFLNKILTLVLALWNKLV
jgi:hypothetical protein